ncbi:MAG: hypothetical protein LVQ95_01860 [Candidatus Micrarchaeales archaeon]|nr:hypothetical protein [Candidatus Micrarchaeales archaeon]
MDFKGIIIEESLDEKSVLRGLRITKTEVEKVTEEFNTPWLERWTLHHVVVPEKDVERVVNEIRKAISLGHKSAWFANLENNETSFIIFKDKVFKYRKGDKKEMRKVFEFGTSIGIPAHQLRAYA